eukprot:scaffold1486_cov329-Prasinococcus_capsulatus_cf.AAC.7
MPPRACGPAAAAAASNSLTNAHPHDQTPRGDRHRPDRRRPVGLAPTGRGLAPPRACLGSGARRVVKLPPPAQACGRDP